jgi:hypothetical protein
MIVKGVRLRNFRGFRNAGLELRPLTVLLGPNSAGKSSFGHALAAMAHSQLVHSGSTTLATLSPQNIEASETWPVDLGGYRDLCTDGVTDRVYVEIHTRKGDLTYGFGGIPTLNDLRLSYIKPPQGPLQTGSVPSKTRQRGAADPKAATTATSRKRVRIHVDGSPLELLRMNEVQWTSADERPLQVGINGLLLESVFHHTGTQIPIDTETKTGFRDFLSQTTYLRASRRRPSRGYAPAPQSLTSIGYAGEWTSSVLRNRADDRVTVVEPPSIPDPRATSDWRPDAPWKRKQYALKEAVWFWLKRTGLGDSADVSDSNRYQGRLAISVVPPHTKKRRDLTEIGYGISQVLPVFVGGLLQGEKGLFIVDLPEAHLHPRPQAALADFFCSLALSGRYSLVETHSEMFFHRLRLLAAMNQDLMKCIAVYFFDEPTDGLCNDPRIVGLQLEDQFRWPVGFFQEGWETESRISAARGARRRARKNAKASS